MPASSVMSRMLISAVLGLSVSRPVHGLDDIVALAELLKCSPGVGDQRPPPGLNLPDEAITFQPLGPIDQEVAVGADGVAVAGIGPKVDNTLFPLLGDQHPVEPGQPLGVHLTGQLAG